MPYADKEKQKKYVQAWWKRHPDANTEKCRKWRLAHPDKALLRAARARAKKNGLDFNLEVSDIQIPETCPILGIPIISTGVSKKGEPSPNAPSLDRIDNSKGYVKGNVWVISWRANSLKSDASLEELEKLVVALSKLKGD